MAKDLYQVSPSMVTFENLNELLIAMDISIEMHKKHVEMYSNILGVMLRAANGDNSGQQQALGLTDANPQNGQDNQDIPGFDRSSLQVQISQRGSKKNGRNKPEEELQGWSILQADDFSIKIATGSTDVVNSKKAEALFKIVEALKSKQSTLESARRLLAELPSRGLRADQRLSVVLKDGIPRQILPTNESSVQQNKFKFATDFEIEPMRLH